LAAAAITVALASNTLQDFMHSVLFNQMLEQDKSLNGIEKCFKYMSDVVEQQREGEKFTQQQMIFLRIMCLSSVLHGSSSTVSSMRTRGLMQLMFAPYWSMSDIQRDAVRRSKEIISDLPLKAKMLTYLRITAHTACMELAVVVTIVIYWHTVLSDGAVTSNWNGVYDEMLRTSNSTTWNVSRGQDPRIISDLIYLMTDVLLASLSLAAVCPVPISALLILLLPITIVIQVFLFVSLCFERLCCGLTDAFAGRIHDATASRSGISGV